MQKTVDLLKEYERINEKFAEPMDDEQMNKLLERQGEVQEKLDHLNAWDLDQQLEMAMDALRCPPGDALIKVLSRRRAAARGAVPAAAAEAGRADPRRADQSPRRRDRSAGSNSTCKRYAGTVIAVTHDRYFLDNVAGWILELDRGEGIPWKGNYSSLARAEAGPAGDRREAGIGPPESAGARAGVGAPIPQRPAGQEQGPRSPPTRTC